MLIKCDHLAGPLPPPLLSLGAPPAVPLPPLSNYLPSASLPTRRGRRTGCATGEESGARGLCYAFRARLTLKATRRRPSRRSHRQGYGAVGAPVTPVSDRL